MFQSKKRGAEVGAGPAGALARLSDPRKEPLSRGKHLRTALASLSPYERRGLLEQCSVETFQLSQDLLALRPSPESLELALFALEQLLLHLPDLVGQKWQFHGLGAALRRLLNPHNDPALRRRALKLFLYWYQILGVCKHGPLLGELDALFAVLVPHFPRADGASSEALLEALCSGPSAGAPPGCPVTPSPALPLLPVPEKAATQSQALQEFLESLLKAISYVTNVEWPHKKQFYQLKSFRFLLDKFRQFYLPVVFPDLSSGEAMSLGLPTGPVPKSAQPMNDPLVICKYCVVRWLNLYTMTHSTDSLGSSGRLLSEVESPRGLAGSVSSGSGVSKASVAATSKLPASYALIRGVLFESEERATLTLGLLRQGLFLPLPLERVMLRILRSLREWVLGEAACPLEESEGLPETSRLRGQRRLALLVELLCSWYWNPYLGAEWTRNAGPTLQLSAKILGLVKELASPQRGPGVELSRETWEAVLGGLLRVVERTVPPSRDLTQAFPAAVATSLFQTLLISWVLATAVCAVPISGELWDRLAQLLTARTSWPQLVEEWARVMESTTRALGASVYDVDLLNAPPEKLRSHVGLRSAKPRTASDIRSRANGGSVLSQRQAKTTTDDMMDFVGQADKRGSLVGGSLGSQTAAPPSSSPSSGIDSSDNLKGSSVSSPPVDQRSGSEADASVDSANPESLSIGGETTSLHSADFPGIQSDRDSEKTSLFGEVPESPDLPTEEEPPVDEEEVELTPRLHQTDGPGDPKDSAWLWALVWRRVLGSIGELSEIPPPSAAAPDSSDSHLRAVRALGRMAEMLVEVGEAQRGGAGLVPPVSLLGRLLLTVATDPRREVAESREEATRLLCRTLLRGRGREAEDEALQAHFYHALHKALEDGVKGAAEEALLCVAPSVLQGSHVLLLPDCLSAAQQILNSQLSGPVLNSSAGFLASLSGLAVSYPLPESLPKPLELSRRSTKSLLQILSFSESRRTDYSMNAAINGIGLFLLNRQLESRGSAEDDQLIHDCVAGLLRTLEAREAEWGVKVVEVLGRVVEREWEPWTERLVEGLVECLDRTRDSEGGAVLAQRLVLVLSEWLLSQGSLGSGGEDKARSAHLSRSVLWALSSAAGPDSTESLRCAARAALMSIARSFGQLPLPGFSAAQAGCSLETELQLQPASHLTLAVGPARIASFLSRPPEARPSPDLVVLRNQAGKQVWELRDQTHLASEDSGPSDLDTWLAEAQQDLERTEKRTSSEEEKGRCGLGQVLEEIRLTSPECMRDETERRPLPLESELRSALHALPVPPRPQPSSAEPRKSSTARDEELGSGWRRLLGDLAFAEEDQVRPLAQLGSDPAQLKRQLKHLDAQAVRELHKLALFYVGPGQEEKAEILGNEAGSVGFEELVAGLGWEVGLEGHSGYAGGLHPPGSTAYRAWPLASEALYHVSTRLSPDDPNKKLRHLGNDEVHLVFSEHSRPYKRSAIPTAFGDVVVAVRPVGGDLFRLAVEGSEGGRGLGPLVDGAVVRGPLLAELLTATALGASLGLRAGREGWLPAAAQRAAVLASTAAPTQAPAMAATLQALLAPMAPPQRPQPQATSPPSSLHVSHSSSPVNV